MSDLIFETLLAEASFRVAELMVKGVHLDEAISEVAGEMELDRREINELNVRTKKTPTPKPAPVKEDDVELISEPASEEATGDNTIAFTSDEELETAVGVLMYKGIPWVSKDITSITFMTPDCVRKAHDALRRRWDFVNLEERVVARVEFDNLEDYQKVLDFMASKNMMIQPKGGEDLAEDLDLEMTKAIEDHKRAKRDAKEAGLPAPEMTNPEMSYRAIHKDDRFEPKPLDDKASREVKVLKRWK